MPCIVRRQAALCSECATAVTRLVLQPLAAAPARAEPIQAWATAAGLRPPQD